jgi:hypothetical protein
MERRGFLTGVVTIGLTAGCTTDSSEAETPQDTDGDGIPDEHDYAPSDPDIQSRSDVLTPSPISTDTQTETRAPTATPTSTTTATPKPSSPFIIQANSAPLEGVSHHPVHYSSQHATIRIYTELLNNSFPNGADLLAIILGYPGTARSGEVIDYYRSGTLVSMLRGDVSERMEFDTRVSPDVPFYYAFSLVPTGSDFSSLDPDEAEFLCETDRLTIRSGGLKRSRHPAEPGDDYTNRYTRKAAEGAYVLEFSGRSYSSDWNARFTAFKHGYIEDIIEQGYNDQRQYVYEAYNDGLANKFGQILNDQAEANGITGDRQKVEFLIDFIQNLPYIPDDVSTGFDDYTKRHLETLLEGGGDCEDSAIMLASLLISDSFNYGTALIFPPGHVAVGVKGGDNIDGYYFEKNGRDHGSRLERW